MGGEAVDYHLQENHVKCLDKVSLLFPNNFIQKYVWEY